MGIRTHARGAIPSETTSVPVLASAELHINRAKEFEPFLLSPYLSFTATIKSLAMCARVFVRKRARASVLFDTLAGAGFTSSAFFCLSHYMRFTELPVYTYRVSYICLRTWAFGAAFGAVRYVDDMGDLGKYSGDQFEDAFLLLKNSKLAAIFTRYKY